MARSRVLSFMSQWSVPQNPNRSPADTPPSPNSTQPLKQYSNDSVPAATAAASLTFSSSTAQLDNPAQSSPTPRQRNRTSSRPSSRPSSMVQTYQPPLMEVAQDTLPELQPIFTYLNSHSNKLYQEGYFLKLHDLDTRGRPSTDRTWQECFAQLVGTVLSLWDAAELDAAGRDGEVVPAFINLADASIKMLESLPMNEGGQVLSNVLSISTAANNRYLLHFNSLNSLTQWTAGIRLSLYEHTTLQEAYTGSLVAGKGKILNNIRAIMDRTRFKYEDWARVRFGAGTPWRRCWFVITPPDEKEYQKMQKSWKKKAPYEKMPVLKGDLKFYDSKKVTKRSRPIATIKDAWSAYAVYPQSKPLIDQSTLVKIEGRITIHSSPESSADGFVFVMPEVHPAVSGFEIMLRFLFPVWDVFALYGRPNKLIAETLDSRGLMFALPKDRRYGYLDILDVSRLIHTDGNGEWTERRWRKEMKDLTAERMAAAADGSAPNRRSSSRRNTGSRISLPPARSNTLRFDESAPGRNTPSQSRERGSPPRSSLSHRRSASEALGNRPSQRQPPSRWPEQNGGYESDATPPRPPPHRMADPSKDVPKAAGLELYDTSSEGRDTPDRASPEAEGTPPPSQHALPEMRSLSSPEPVSPPPSFAHAPRSRPPTQPNPAPELRRGHSGLDNATISQMAEANQMQNTQAGAMQQPHRGFNFDGQIRSGYADEHSGVVGAARSLRGVAEGTHADAQHEGPLNARLGHPTTRLATIPASPYIPQGEPSPVPAVASQPRPTNKSPSQFPQRSHQPPSLMTDVPRKESEPSASSSPSQYSPHTPASGAVDGSQPAALARSTSNFSIHRKPLPRSSLDQTRPTEGRSSLEGSPQPKATSEDITSDAPQSTFLRDPSPDRPRMGRMKTVGSVDLTKQDLVIGDAHFINTQKPASSTDDLPKIDFGPTYRLDPTKKTGPPSAGTSAGASPNASASGTLQTESPSAPPDNRSASSLGNRPKHMPTGSQTHLPLRPAYAHKSTPSAESLTKQKPSNSGRTTPSGFGRVTPSGGERDQQHMETMKRIEALPNEIAAVELRPIEMDPIQYDGQTLPRVLVFFLHQFRPRGQQIAVDDSRERQERSRILAISKQVYQRYDEEQRQRREQAARQRAEMPPPGPMRPPSRNRAQPGYVDPRFVNQLQQQVRMNPKPQGLPGYGNPQQGSHPGYAQPGGGSDNWTHGRGPPGGHTPHANPQQSAYGAINPNAGYSQEEAIRAGRFGPLPGGRSQTPPHTMPNQGNNPAMPPRSVTPGMYGYGQQQQHSQG